MMPIPRNVWGYRTETGEHVNLTEGFPVPLEDQEHDNLGERPPYGIGGFTKDNKSVILQARYDLYLQLESFQGERGPGAVAEEPLQAGPVGGLDTDAGIKTEPAAVIPGEHVLGVVGFQEAVAAAMPQDPGADRMLESLQELGGEGGGFVEAEGGFWSG